MLYGLRVGRSGSLMMLSESGGYVYVVCVEYVFELHVFVLNTVYVKL